MNAYLVTWNPKKKPWNDLAFLAGKTKEGIPVDEWWNVSNTGIDVGDRLFLLKQGSTLPRGIFASGNATSSVRRRPHWIAERAEKGETVTYVDAIWDTILNPDEERLLQVATIQKDDLPQVHWNTQSSGILIEPTVAQWMESLWASHIDEIRGSYAPLSVDSNDDPESEEFAEGKVCYRLHRQHERNPLLTKRKKAAVLAATGTLACTICNFDFFETYGGVGKEFIECHHTIPVSELREGMKTHLRDVVVVCSNCHRMLHRKRPWLRINELSALLK